MAGDHREHVRPVNDLGRWSPCPRPPFSLEHTRRLAREGRTSEALLEASACASLGREAPEARIFHDEILSSQAEAIQNPAEAWNEVSRPYLTASGRSRTVDHALAISVREAGALQKQGSFDAAAALVAQIPADVRGDERVRQIERTDHIHRAEELWDKIRARDSLAETLAACQAIQLYLEDLETSETSLTKVRVDAACASAEARQQQEIARHEREERRRQEAEERERRRAERAAAAAQRGCELAPLLCRDGSLSPSCICGGSHRGCCSHHGGVAGCSR